MTIVQAVAVVLVVALLLGLRTTNRKGDAAGRGLAQVYCLAAGVPVGLSLLARLFGEWLASRVWIGFAWGLVVFPFVLGSGLWLGGSLASARRRRLAHGAGFRNPGLRAVAAAVAAGDLPALRDRAKGVDLSMVAPSGATLASFAIERQSHAALAELLRLGADPNGKDQRGEPLVFQALHRSDIASFELLKRAGADPLVVDYRGFTTALLLAWISQYELALEMLERGVDPDRASGDGATLRQVMRRQEELPACREQPGYARLAAFLEMR